jgi:hypothetical protein
VTTDTETLITALYVKIDDGLKRSRWRGRPTLLTDAELICLANPKIGERGAVRDAAGGASF